MEPSKDPISVRVAQLNSQLVSTKVAETNSNLVSREGLLDVLTVLYSECNTECLKKYDQQIATFIDKHRTVLNQIKCLRVNVTDFEVKNVIGRGHFGEVHVVKERQTGDVYAMKTVRKTTCLAQKNSWFEEERNIMARSTSPWLTSLQYSFQDNNLLYFIMEYHPGGDLLGLLQRQGGTIPESAASFYIAELVVALNDLHTMRYVHRDIKPDNILLDRCGHIKLVDFGSAAKLNANEFVNAGMPVGTPDYIAPEVLQSSENKTNKKSSYGISADYWSVGILAYQLTVGVTPFGGSNMMSIYSKIMNYKSSLKFPPEIVLSQAYVSLIKDLLTDSSVRLNYEQILKHALFKQIDFSGLRNQVPPYVPKVSSGDDTSNFFDIPPKKREPNIDNFKTKTQFSGKNLPFVGFTYTHDLYEYKQSYPSSQPVVKDERVQELQKEVKALHKKLLQTKDSMEDVGNMEKKLEERTANLENLENLRDRLERDLANSITECSALKRTLELERKDRVDLEHKALDLIKSAKIKWENSEKKLIEKLHLELAQQIEKIQQLTATNSLLNEQLQHALQLENKHKTSLDNVQQLNRQSIVGLESRLGRVTSDTQNKISELQNKLADETHKKTVLKNQVASFQYSQASLMEKLKLNEANCNELLIKLEANQKLIRELENKNVVLEEASKTVEDHRERARLLEEQISKLRNDQRIQELENEVQKEKTNCVSLRQQIQDLKDTSTVSHETLMHEQKEHYARYLKDVQEQLSKTLEDKEKLSEKLAEAKLNDETNKLKVQTLEDLLKRLECGVSKLENDCDKENVLKEQIERLEQQLIMVHQSSAVEKQELNQLKSKCWRLEKDLSNAEIDKRIYKRELKEAEEANKQSTMEIEKIKAQNAEINKMHENALLELENLNENLANEVVKLKEALRHVECKIEMEREKCDEEKTLVAQLKKKLEAKEVTLASTVKILEISRQEKQELNRKLEVAEITQQNMRQKADNSTKETDLLHNELENCQRKFQNTELNLNALREACSLLENQLIEYENIHASYETKQRSLNSNTEKLIGELALAKEEIQRVKKLLNEEISLKLMAETKCNRLKEDVDSLQGECSSYKQQCVDFRQYSTNLTDELTVAEEKITDYEVTIKSYERQITNLVSENNSLREENATQLTHLNNIKESNYQLGKQLVDFKRNNDALCENVDALQDTLNQKNNFFKERELKSDGTIQQQIKLIDFLQSKVEECKKKKTFSDKLFGHNKKENQPPLPASLNYKELEGLLTKERVTNGELRHEISKLKSGIVKNGKTSREILNTPMSPRTKVTLEKLAQSPNTQSHNLFRQNSTQRMHHNIPHRFESKLCTRTTKCSHCSNNIVIGRNVKYCVECHIATHPNCASYLPKTCGIPQAYVKHYSESINKVVSMESVKQDAVPEDVNIEGWVKIPVRGNTGWDRHYACLTTSTVKIYAQPPNSTNISPIISFDLKAPNSHGTVILEPVLSEIGTPIATSDLPFIIKIDVSPDTTCWPSQSLILMMLSVQDKDKWFKALRAILNVEEPTYIGELVTKTSDLDINCIVDIDSDTTLFGTKEGLYAYRSNEILNIAGLLNVQQIILLNTVNLAVMIVDSNRFLITCDLNHLIDLTKCARCSKPTLTFKTINVNNLEGFHVVQGSRSKNHPTLAVATSKQLVILGYDFKQSDFKVVRVLDTAQPTSCVLFTDHTLIVGANKFFEIDLVTFEADEFLDESDPKLAQAILCYSVGSFPVAIMQISKQPVEYLLCFHELAVFVDEFGRCSRASDIKWSQLPQALHFHAPYLYVVQLSSIEMIKVAEDTCNVMANSMESLLNVDSFKVDLPNPYLIGVGRNGIYIAVGEEIRLIEAKRVDSDALSLISDGTVQSETKGSEGGQSEEFSFTSSMVQSLDDLSDTESNSEEVFNYKQKKVTFDSRFTNL